MAEGSVNALHIAIVAAVVGWLVFSLSQSIAVWSKRNAEPRQQRSYGLLFAALLLCGAALLGGWLNRELTRRSGVITGTDFFVVRAHGNATAHPRSAEVFKAGAVLATYEAPEVEREAQQLRDQIAILRQQGHVSALQPLALSPELVRAAQEQADTQRARLSQLGFGELDSVGQGSDLFAAERAKSEAASHELERTATLVHEGILARAKLDAAQAAAQGTAQDLRQREELLLSAREGTAALGQTHRALVADAHRAAVERNAEQAELNTRIAALENDLQHLQAEQVIVAPFDGKVVYRHPSPALAAQGQAVLALAKGPGFVATVQVPTREAAMLRPGQLLTVKLERYLVNASVPGRLLGADPAPGSNELSVLRVECDLPAEQFASFSSGSVPVTLSWRPPLLSSRFTQGGLMLAAGLGLWWCMAGLFAGRRPRAAEVEKVLARLDTRVAPQGAQL